MGFNNMFAELNGDRLNGTHRKRVKKPAVESTRPTGSAVPADPLMGWSRAGIGLAIVLSAGLNGYANAEHAAVPWAGWVIGVWVPALVLVLARVSGGAYARGWHGLATAGGVVVLALLGLSVSHCARAFTLLTGADDLSAVLMAVGIDCGLVVCELMTVRPKGR